VCLEPSLWAPSCAGFLGLSPALGDTTVQDAFGALSQVLRDDIRGHQVTAVCARGSLVCDKRLNSPQRSQDATCGSHRGSMARNTPIGYSRHIKSEATRGGVCPHPGPCSADPAKVRLPARSAGEGDADDAEAGGGAVCRMGSVIRPQEQVLCRERLCVTCRGSSTAFVQCRYHGEHLQQICSLLSSLLTQM
jgi:hypothetical protein